MPAIVEYPQVVCEAVAQFGDLFANQPQRDHFAEYLTGLFLARRKTVSGIHAEFTGLMGISDQSCLNRFLTTVEWDAKQLNQRRLEWLQTRSDTRYSEEGTIAIDNVLIDHSGKTIDDVGYFWDHAEERHKIAHDYLFANYVCGGGKHYPLEFRRFQKRAHCEAANVPFTDHTELCCQLIDWTWEQGIPGILAFDCYFTHAVILNHIHEQKTERGESRGYVGALKTNRKVHYRGREMTLQELADSIPPDDRTEVRRKGARQWVYSCTLHIPHVNHKVRIVLIWKHRRDNKVAIVLVTNRTHWEVRRTLAGYEPRWTGTETFHRDGKQELGMGDCQLRDGQGQTRHMYLVMVAYSLLMAQLHSPTTREWALKTLTTIGEACRGIFRETLRKTLAAALDFMQLHHKKSRQIQALFGLT